MTLENPDARSLLRHSIKNKKLVVSLLEHRMGRNAAMLAGLGPVLNTEIGLLTELEALQQGLPAEIDHETCLRINSTVTSVEERSHANQLRAAAVMRR